MLCDSNIIIYAIDPLDQFCAPFAERRDAAIASISRIEVLGFPRFGELSPLTRHKRDQITPKLEAVVFQKDSHSGSVASQTRSTPTLNEV